MAKNRDTKKIIIRISFVAVAVVLLLVYAFMTFYYLNRITSQDRTTATQTKVIAHRGHSKLYMENTIDAFNSACSTPYFAGVETDVWRTKDGVFVCSHNSNPFVDKSITIPNSNYEDIKKLPIDTSMVSYDIDKTNNYYICTLRDYLIGCLSSSKIALVEIKQDFSATEVEEFLAFISGKISHKNLFIGSFNKKVIEAIHKRSSYYRVLLFTSDSFVSNLYVALGYNIGVSQKALSESTVKKAHSKNSYTFVYTVNTSEQFVRFKDMAVDFVISDGILD